MKSLFFLNVFFILFIGCKPDEISEIKKEINNCKLNSIKTVSDINEFNTRIEAISQKIEGLNKNKYTIDEILEIKKEAEEINEIRSKELIKFISLKLEKIKNNNENQLYDLSQLTSEISNSYSKYIFEADKSELNVIIEDIETFKLSLEMESKWKKWKDNLRTKIKDEIDKEWRILIDNKYHYQINTINYEKFDINLKLTPITDSPIKKLIQLDFTGEFKCIVNEGIVDEDLHEFNCQINGLYNSSCEIGNEPYLDKININLQDHYIRKIKD